MSFELKNVRIPYTLPWWRAFLFSASRLPAKLFRRLNTVVDFFEWSCEGNLIMYVETLLPALGELMLALVDFDYDDVVRGFLRPYGPSSRKTLVFDPRKSKAKFEIPELGEEIGKRIPGAKFFKASRIWGATRFLWVLDGVIQRALYYYLLIDVLSEFLYNWSSGILRHESCATGGCIFEGGYYGDSGDVGDKIIGWWGPSTTKRCIGDFDAVILDAPYIIAKRPASILYDFKLVPVFPLACRFTYVPYLASEDGKPVDVGFECFSWQREEDRYFFDLVEVKSTDKTGALGVFRIPAPGRYQIRARVTWSQCYTIAQQINRIVIK